MYLKIAFFVLCVAYTEAKKCPQVRTAKNFNLTAFATGVWHDLARYPNPLETSEGCSSLRYTYNGGIVTLENQVPVKGPNFLYGSGRPRPDGSIELTGTLGSANTPFEVVLTVLKVKYDKYAIKYYCVENGDDIIEFAWVISRSTNLDAAAKEELNKFIKSSKVVDVNRLMWLKFSDNLCKMK